MENPQAFPRWTGDWETSDQGMTLRDYFAGQALIGCLNYDRTMNENIKYAYGIADAMLKQRQKPGG